MKVVPVHLSHPDYEDLFLKLHLIHQLPDLIYFNKYIPLPSDNEDLRCLVLF